MNIHEFGRENPDILLMFHGSCMFWDMYEEAIERLSGHFHVVIPALPGHDPETTEDYTSVEDIAREMEDWLLGRKKDGSVYLYGLSMGGSIVLRMLADDRLTIRRAIVDGGITPYQLPRLITRFIAARDYLMVQVGRSSKKMLEMVFPPEKYTKEGTDYLYKAIRHMSSKTVWRVFDSCNNYSMPESVPETSAEIEYWYGEAEKRARAWDIAYVKKNFPRVHFRELPGFDHGEYCMIRQKEFADDVISALSRTIPCSPIG